MIRKCDETDYSMLMDYLSREPVYHTFMIADIAQYGFDKDYQEVYAQETGFGVSGIFLKYYNNFIVAGDEEAIDYNEAARLVTDEVATIMGKAKLVECICAVLKRKHIYEQKTLYVLQKRMEAPKDSGVRLATLQDVDRIYGFLMDIPQLSPLYSQKAMIENRIRSGEGIHAVMEREGKVIAHGNSAASTDCAVMLGGIGVIPGRRRQGCATAIVKRLCVEIQRGGRIPCTFAGDPVSRAMWGKLGFEEYGFWGMARLEENSDGGDD